MAMVSTMTARYGDEALSSTIVSAKDLPITRAIAQKLEKAQLKNWVSAGKTADDVFKAQNSPHTRTTAEGLQEKLWLSNKVSPDDAFKLLNLEKDGRHVLESPALNTWISYVSKLNKNRDDDFTVIAKLKDVLGSDMELARALRSSTSQASMTMKSFQELQFKQWVQRGVDPKWLSMKGYDPAKDAGVLLAFHDYYVARVAIAY
ncbi:unnamed protein product [Phytophthora lilii]|uniref:Unnamed protein product n=1 Tax=Phytophthora lilii TaxID=2077276 RepID=A0A9W6WXI4_9STRA|nr:unnamed protein product [Phytophthora lilii]